MIYLPALLAAVPSSVEWSPTVALVMTICNVLAIALGKYGIRQPSVGPALPASEFFGGMGVGAMLGVMSFGHILGAGAILGLATLGVL